VDDSDDDRALFRFALKKGSERLHLLEPVTNGHEAIEYLSGAGRYADRSTHPLPDVLVLDLKMPGKNGFDVLDWLRMQVHRPVVIVLSGSDQTRDVEKAISLGANHYRVKPSELGDWIGTIQHIEGCAQDAGQSQIMQPAEA